MMGDVINRNLKIITILAVIGIIISSFLLYLKMSGGESFCDFSAEISCDAVSQSPYAELPPNSGIPIAGLGIIAFLLYIIPSIWLMKAKEKILGMEKKTIHYLLLAWGVFSLIFYAYLTYLELYVIYAICPLCVVEAIITIVMFIFIVYNVKIMRDES
ncbi:MAG: vitamin K epoxide reductase family protein [Candidatus Aenigmatarchaeota archaeon]